MNTDFQALMREATRLTRGGQLHEATQTLQRALGGLPGTAPAMASGPIARLPALPTALAADPSPIAFEDIIADPRASWIRARPEAGDFRSGSHTHASLSRRYRLYVPPAALDTGAGSGALPLIVMLHGCTQDPDDFAAGTAMNERAREQGFFVLYPAQAQDANPSRCWNWFKHNHQQRDRGEPALLADLTRTVIKSHRIDERRVHVAGLSAGAAMAVILGAAYPDIFAAVGVHSGLPGGAARDMAGALAAMRGGATPAPAARAPAPVPTIVFHGDQDRTVHPRNGEQVVADALRSGNGAASTRVERGVSARGQAYTRSTHLDAAGRTLAEHWLVHGAGHAWSGGRAEGSFTDTRGPDATQEMLRFFNEHPRQ